MHDQPNNIKPIVIQPTPKQNGNRPRAKPLRDFFHISEVLPAVFQRIIKAVEERESGEGLTR